MKRGEPQLIESIVLSMSPQELQEQYDQTKNKVQENHLEILKELEMDRFDQPIPKILCSNSDSDSSNELKSEKQIKIRKRSRKFLSNKIKQINISEKNICPVCERNESTLNCFGTSVCHPCDTFFRRWFRVERPPCKCDYQTKTNIVKSRSRCCTSCRYEKCLSVGMDPNRGHIYEKQRHSKSSKKICIAVFVKRPKCWI